MQKFKILRIYKIIRKRTWVRILTEIERDDLHRFHPSGDEELDPDQMAEAGRQARSCVHGERIGSGGLRILQSSRIVESRSLTETGRGSDVSGCYPAGDIPKNNYKFKNATRKCQRVKKRVWCEGRRFIWCTHIWRSTITRQYVIAADELWRKTNKSVMEKNK